MTLPNLAWDWSEPGQIAALGRVLCAALDRGSQNPATCSLIAGKAQRLAALKGELPDTALEAMERFGLVSQDGGVIHPLFHAKTIGDFLVFSDLPRSMRTTRLSRHRNSYVDPMWDGPVMTNLMLRGAVENGLDMGCGCGVIALAMSAFCRKVYALDVNPRALMLARFNVALNGVRNVEVLESDLFAAVAGKTFERIVFNAPVGVELQPRNALESGEQILERFFAEAGHHLAPDGIVQMNLCVKEWSNASFGQSFKQWTAASARPMQFLFMELWRINTGWRFHVRRLLAPFLVGRSRGSLVAMRRGLLFFRHHSGGRDLEVPTRYDRWAPRLGPDFGGALVRCALDIQDAETCSPADMLAALDNTGRPIGKDVIDAFTRAADTRAKTSQPQETPKRVRSGTAHQPA